MKRQTFILLIFITVLSCTNTSQKNSLTQSTKNDIVENSCRKMQTQALNDLKERKYKLYEFGITSSPDTNRVILKKYGIELVYGGCEVIDGIECYRTIMDSAIKAKYKNNIIEYSDSFDRIRFKDEFFNLKDSTCITENSKKITKTVNSLDSITSGKVIIQIYINQQGKPTKIKWLKGLDKKNTENLTTKLMKETFIPLTIKKEKVNSILTIPIKIK